MGEVPLYVTLGRGEFDRVARSHFTAANRDGNNLKSFQDPCLDNGSSQGLYLALTVLFVPNSLDSGAAC